MIAHVLPGLIACTICTVLALWQAIKEFHSYWKAIDQGRKPGPKNLIFGTGFLLGMFIHLGLVVIMISKLGIIKEIPNPFLP